MTQTFNGISHFTIYQHELTNYRNDSRNSLSEYKARKLSRTTFFKVLVILALPFYLLATMRKTEIGLAVAVGMSAALVAHTTLV